MQKVPGRLIRTKSDEAAIDAGCWFDQSSADRVRYFFARFLRHSKGEWAGKPYELIDWQWRDIIEPFYGWKKPDGSRRFTREYVEIPKKNGKSTLYAGRGLYHLCGDGESGPEVYCAAADKRQASIIYNEAANMVKSSPNLRKWLVLLDSRKTINHPSANGFMQALSADVPTKEGLNASAILFDELHAQSKRDLYNTLRYAGAARRQPFTGYITTAGYDRDSVCWDLHTSAKAILSGERIDVSLLAVIYAADDEEDWRDEAVWRRVNPSYGITLNASTFADDYAQAAESNAEENNFRRYHLNQWTQSAVRWLDKDRWNACKVESFDAGDNKPECWISLDLSAVSDITALVQTFRLPNGDVGSREWYWRPRNGRRRKDRSIQAKLEKWARDGHITLTDKPTVDHQAMRDKIAEIRRDWKVKEVVLDPWNATQISNDLEVDGLKVFWMRQGFASLSGPSKALERRVLDGTIKHLGNPVTEWMVQNVMVETDSAENIKPSKKASKEKIDGVVALVMALGRMFDSGVVKQSVYSSRGVETI